MDFLIDFKNILKIYCIYFLIEALLVIILYLTLFINIIVVGIYLLLFIAVQFYLYYKFQKRLIKKVYNPSFNKNKNIIITILVNLSMFLIYALMTFFIVVLFLKYRFSIDIFEIFFKYKIVFYIGSFIPLFAYNFLLLDIKEMKNTFATTFLFWLIQFVLKIIIKIIFYMVLILVFILFYNLEDIMLQMSVVVYFAFVIFENTLYKTIHITIAKYFRSKEEVKEVIK